LLVAITGGKWLRGHCLLEFLAVLGLKTGENQRVLFTDEYIVIISKLFTPFMLSEI
jgi:hypothetical protein